MLHQQYQSCWWRTSANTGTHLVHCVLFVFGWMLLWRCMCGAARYLLRPPRHSFHPIISDLHPLTNHVVASVLGFALAFCSGLYVLLSMGSLVLFGSEVEANVLRSITPGVWVNVCAMDMEIAHTLCSSHRGAGTRGGPDHGQRDVLLRAQCLFGFVGDIVSTSNVARASFLVAIDRERSRFCAGRILPNDVWITFNSGVAGGGVPISVGGAAVDWYVMA